MTEQPNTPKLISPVRPGAQGPVDSRGNKVGIPLQEITAETVRRGIAEDDDVPEKRVLNWQAKLQK